MKVTHHSRGISEIACDSFKLTERAKDGSRIYRIFSIPWFKKKINFGIYDETVPRIPAYKDMQLHVNYSTQEYHVRTLRSLICSAWYSLGIMEFSKYER